jgi:predicted O-linked N-acetylglucosamine transferase (SPINDLY family)
MQRNADSPKQKKNPDHWYWHGRACLDAQNWTGAVSALSQGIRLAPDQPAFHRARGLALARLDRFDDAMRDFRSAIRLLPAMALAHSDLGVCLLKTNRPRDAIAPLERALRLEPTLHQARASLGVAYAHAGEPDRALAILDALVENDPDPEIHSARGWALLGQGQVEAALDVLRRTLRLNPNHAVAHYNLLFTLQHRVGITEGELLDAHSHWGSWAVAQEAGAPSPRLGATGRPLRIGIVSGDLRRHAVSSLTLRAFEALAGQGFTILCFASQSEEDDHAARWRALAREWHRVDQMNDDALTALIARKRIDILFDLAGLTARHRLPVFARRAAPRQVSWAGYTGTLGLPTMDGLIADPREVPPGHESFYAETVLRLPDCYVCYEPLGPVPDVADAPPSASGPPVFGCFQRAAKLNVPLLALWARIARALPDARFMLRYSCYAEAQTRDTVGRMATQAGLDPTRLIFDEGGPTTEMMQAYTGVDVALDTRPYSGGVTTLEALWMGVPVVTWPGETFAGRHSASHLHAAGLTELVVDSGDAYVDAAVALASDPGRLARYRRTLRAQVEASPLCDAQRFATHLGQVLTDWVHGGNLRQPVATNLLPSDAAGR